MIEPAFKKLHTLDSQNNLEMTERPNLIILKWERTHRCWANLEVGIACFSSIMACPHASRRC